MTGCREAVASAVSAVSISPPLGFSWFGKMFRPPDRRASLTFPAHLARQYLLYSLQLQLYNDFYCKGGAAPNTVQESSSVNSGAFTFVQRLEAASGTRRWDDEGWEVLAATDSEVVVRKNGLTLRARPQDCTAAADEILIPGLSVSVRLPSSLAHSSPGFYTIIGSRCRQQQGNNLIVRLYWNVTAEAAPAFVREVTELLNGAGVSFRLKILCDPRRFVRCDAAVLYLDRAEYCRFRSTLEDLYTRVASMLKPATPVFARRLAEGLGLAEDPPNYGSFGMHRCRLLAEGLLFAHECRVRTIDDRVQAVVTRFEEEGLSFAQPYLNSGSSDQYEFAVSDSARTVFRAGEQRSFNGSAESPREQFIDTAAEIAATLARQSVWYSGQCNWIGSAPAQSDGSSSSRTPLINTSSLGPDLYAGTSGVALYLAELFRITADKSMSRLSLGAIRHALSHVDAVPPAVSASLYTGWTGIALAASRIAHVLENEQLLEHARKLVRRIVRSPLAVESDVLSGAAGAVMGLLLLRQTVGDPDDRLLTAAIRFADGLVTSATATRRGLSWKSVAVRHRRNLTGFSHGVAGVACALLETYAATGERRFAEAAENALRYEQTCFDADVGNWPDFRYPVARGSRAASFAIAWCHGAPGIALSRIRAYQVLRCESYLRQAEVALATTHSALQAQVQSLNGNFCLCHGFAGNADILLEGAASISSPAGQAWGATSIKVATIGQQSCRQRNHRWPCGAGGGEAPGLMTGLAGIGYFYLRLHDRSTPSVLLLSTGFNRPARPPCSESTPASYVEGAVFA